MTKWPMVELGNATEIRGGATPRRDNAAYWGGNIPWVTPTDLPAPGAGIADVQDTTDAITGAGLASCSARVLPPSTVMFSSRASIGKIGIAAVPLTTNQGFINLIPRHGLESRYLAWCLHFHADRISDLAGSTTFKEVSKSALKRFRIPLPPLSEQRRIAEILDQADGLRRLRAEADAKAGHILPAIFLKMFGDPATNPKGWDTKPFREILTESPRNGLSPSSAGTLHAKVLTLSAITGTKFDEAAVKDSQFESLSSGNKGVDCRDFLVCRGNGNLGLMGRARFPHRTLSDTLFPDTIIAARVNPKQVDRSYLEALWQTKWMRLQIESRSTTTSGIHKINQATLSSLPVRLPPLPLQIRFDSLSSRLRHSVEASRTRVLDRLFDSLSHRAFSGELTN